MTVGNDNISRASSRFDPRPRLVHDLGIGQTSKVEGTDFFPFNRARSWSQTKRTPSLPKAPPYPVRDAR